MPDKKKVMNSLLNAVRLWIESGIGPRMMHKYSGSGSAGSIQGKATDD
jgi:hypothetical protein